MDRNERIRIHKEKRNLIQKEWEEIHDWAFDFIKRKNLTCNQFVKIFSIPTNLCQSGKLYPPPSSELSIWKDIYTNRESIENRIFTKSELTRVEYITENYLRNDLYFRNRGVFTIFIKELNNIIQLELSTNCGENIDEEEIKRAAFEILHLGKGDIIDIAKYFNL